MKKILSILIVVICATTLVNAQNPFLDGKVKSNLRDAPSEETISILIERYEKSDHTPVGFTEYYLGVNKKKTFFFLDADPEKWFVFALKGGIGPVVVVVKKDGKIYANWETFDNILSDEETGKVLKQWFEDWLFPFYNAYLPTETID